MGVKVKTAGEEGLAKQSPYEDHLSASAAVPVVKSSKVSKTTTIEKKAGGNVEEEQHIEETDSGVVVPLHRLAHVTVQGGRTINTGNYESVKLGVSITLPCDMDDIHDAYEVGLEFVDTKIAELNEAIEKGYQQE